MDREAFRKRFQAYKDGKPIGEIYNIPRYKDGKRYIKNDDNSWTRITDDEMADQFANLVVTPNKNIEERTVYRPGQADLLTRKEIHDAGYVTDETLARDARLRYDQQLAAHHSERPLETVSPEFDLLLMGAGLRSNSLTQQLWKNRALSKEMNAVFDEGLVGATKEMPVVNAMDMYNPEHMMSTVKYNPKQIAQAAVEGTTNEAPIKAIQPQKAVFKHPEYGDVMTKEDLQQGLHEYPIESSSNNVIDLIHRDNIVANYNAFKTGIRQIERPADNSQTFIFKAGEEPPEATYTGNIPKTIVNQGELGLRIQEILNPDIFTPELKSLPKPTWYDETFVDRNGKVNIRAVARAVKDFYKTHPNAYPYKEIFNSNGNLYDHIKAVVQSAQQIPVPEGYTRQELVQSALFHDIGKVFEHGHSHGHVGAEMLDDLGIDVPESVKRAVDNHMSTGMLDKDELTKALHFADVARGEGWDEAAFKYPHLAYNYPKPELNIPKIPLKEELKTRINPWLKNKGYETIPLDVSEEEAWNILEDRISQHRSFLRGARDPLKNEKIKPDDKRNAANAIESVMEKYGLSKEEASSDAAAFKRIEIAAQDVPKTPTGPSRRSHLFNDEIDKNGLTRHTRSHYSKLIGANPDTKDALYISTSDEVGSGYATANTDDRAGAMYVVELPKSQRKPGESMSEYLLRNDFDMIDLNAIESGHRQGTGSMYEDPYRLQTGRSLQSDLVKEGMVTPKYKNNPEILITPTTPATISRKGISISYSDSEAQMHRINKTLKHLGVSFELNPAKNGGIYMPTKLLDLRYYIDDLEQIYDALTPVEKFSIEKYDLATRQLIHSAGDWDRDNLFGFAFENKLSKLSDEQRQAAIDNATALEDPNYVKYALGIDDIEQGSKKYYKWAFPTSNLIRLRKKGLITDKQYSAIKKAYIHNGDAKKYINFKSIANKLITEYLQSVKKNAHKKRVIDPMSLRATPQQMAEFVRSKGVVPRYEIEGYGDNKVYTIEANAKNKTKNAGDIKRTYGYVLGQKGETKFNIREKVDHKERKFETGAGKDSGKYSKLKISRKTLRSLPPIIATGTAASTLKPRRKKDGEK